MIEQPKQKRIIIYIYVILYIIIGYDCLLGFLISLNHLILHP